MSQKNKKRSSAFFHSRFLAIMSIAVVLFLLGTIGIIEFVGRGIGNSVREDLSFNLLLSSDMDETQAQELQRPHPSSKMSAISLPIKPSKR